MVVVAEEAARRHLLLELQYRHSLLPQEAVMCSGQSALVSLCRRFPACLFYNPCVCRCSKLTSVNSPAVPSSPVASGSGGAAPQPSQAIRSAAPPSRPHPRGGRGGPGMYYFLPSA